MEKKNKLLVGIYVSIAIILIVIIVAMLTRSYNNTVEVGDTIQYTVIKRFPDRNEASRKLHLINNNAIELIKYIKKQNPDPNLFEFELIDLLKNKYNPDELKELDAVWSVGHRAMTDKDKNISMALRKKTGDFYDMNLLMFVFLHELSHVATPVKYTEKDGHPSEFWKTFKFLLIHAEEINIIENINFKEYPSEYCGIPIIYNPYFDESLAW